MAETAAATRLIKRYAQARFYDVDAGSYLSAEDIADLASAEQKIRVLDAATGLDVTEAVLSRVAARRRH
jgi:polyhydroxyalkanoate synthesis regulator protein